MNTIVTLFAFFILLGVVVFIHEMGHYLLARWSGAKILSFSIGFGPALIKWKDKKDTVWKISLLPFGGYVSIYGQEDMFNRKKYNSYSKEEKKGHYLSISPFKQFMIVSGGVLANFILAWVIFTLLFIFKPKNVQLPVVGQVIQNSVAFDAGIKAGDRIIKIDNKQINNWGEIILAKELAENKNAKVLILRNDKIHTLSIKSDKRWGLIADGSYKEINKKGIFQSAYSGLRETYKQSKLIILVLKQIITGERSSKQLGSFISIAKVAGETLSVGFFAFISFIAIISINLAVINLLPLPVLDGGYLFILILEALTRRKFEGKTMNYAIIAGWIFIVFLTLFTLWNDISRIFRL